MDRWRFHTILLLLVFSCFNGCLADEEDYEAKPRDEFNKGDHDFHHFVTRPDIQAPKFNVTIYDEKALAPGYWFVAPYDNIHKGSRGKNWEGGYIYDGYGDMVWASSPTMDRYTLHDFRITRFNDTDFITGISHHHNAGLFFNSHYEMVKSVSWTDKWEHANMHEFNVVENGTRVLVTTRNEPVKLSREESLTVGFDGNCTVKADGIKELDITTDPPKVLFEWTGIEHIPLIDSVKDKKYTNGYCQLKHGWDIHHFNSVDKFADGDYLVNSRETDTMYKISHVNGSIVWRLGWRLGDFKTEDKAHFGAEHDVRIIEETDGHVKLSIFANWSPTKGRGIIVDMDLASKKVSLVQEAGHPLGKNTGSRGSTQVLPNGNMFSCWAGHTRISEHDKDGKMLFHAYYRIDKPPKVPSYRAYKFPWVGRPKYPPNVYSSAFAFGFDRKRVITETYVSWNGATEVAKWRLYGTSNADGSDLKRINETVKTGFETNMMYDGYAEYVVMEALNKNGTAMGRSEVFKTIAPVEGVPDLDRTLKMYDPPDPPPYVPEEEEEDDDDDDDEDEDDFWIDPNLFSPVFTYVYGFLTCAGVMAGMRLASTFRKRPWREWKTPKQENGSAHKYEAVHREDKEALITGDGDSDDEVELRERERE